MRERIPAAQHHDFRKFVFEKRAENRTPTQWADIWIVNNTSGTPPHNNVMPEKVVNHVSKPAPAMMKLIAEGARRTIYQRNAGAQAGFKSRLMALWKGKCGIEGVALSGVLEAAHITHGEDFSDDNGILMTPTMHALFDRHLIGIDPHTLRIHISRTLPELHHQDGSQLNPPLKLNITGLMMRWALYQQTNPNSLHDSVVDILK
ncbi:HNH endonuclease [Pseudomonas graminis]